MKDSRHSKRCFVYWIHLESHLDIFTQGYIGITTKTVIGRFAEHKSYAKHGGKYPISNAINKYADDLIVTTLVESSLDYCLSIESKLRPSENTGWNITRGGGFPLDMTGVKHTDEAKEKISIASKLNSNTDAHIAARKRKVGVKRPKHVIDAVKAYSNSLLPWERGRAKKEIWARADEVYQLHLDNPKYKAIKLAQLMGFTRKALDVIYNKIEKQQWIPNLDPEWVDWHSNYKINKGI